MAVKKKNCAEAPTPSRIPGCRPGAPPASVSTKKEAFMRRTRVPSMMMRRPSVENTIPHTF
jgi:hypothetical protein